MDERGSGSARRAGAAASLASAALFGSSAPASKLLLPTASPLAIAALLYLGGGLGLALLGRAARPGRGPAEARLSRADLPRLAAVVGFGGVVAPVLMLVGLARVSGVAGSLLLNLETPFTILLAVACFGEHLGRRGVACVALVLAGAAVLSLRTGDVRADPVGVLALAAACACWALDNNLTQGLSGKDPVAITRVKCLGAGATNLAAALATGAALPGPGALATGAALPGPGVLAGALGIGFLSYGVGLVLATRALRALGAARHAAYFASAPFVGALVAVPLLAETPTLADGVGLVVMALGVAALLFERHDHEHAHEALEHDHLHRHDEHHGHAHPPGVPATEPHAHPHRHAPLVHAHAHASDLHHRHVH